MTIHNWKAILITATSTTVLSAGAFLIAFPLIPRPWVSRSKPSAAQRAADEVLFKARRTTYVDPILAAIQSGNTGAVRSLWQRFLSSSSYMEDPGLRLDLARYFVKIGASKEAHEQLDKILHPPKGSGSTLRHSGEVMSLWLATADGELKDTKDAVRDAWQEAATLFARSGNASDDPAGDAKVEYLAAQELEAQTKPKDALSHYQRAVALQPDSSFLWKALGQAKLRAGDFAGSKTAMVHAYWTAPASERDKIKLYNRLSDADIARIEP